MVVTLGCRLNLAESETIRLLLGEAAATVVNSCAVTADAVKQTRAAVRRAHRERPGVPVVVTGCAAEIDPDGFATMPEVARVVRQADKLSPAAWGRDRPIRPAAFAGHARAFVEVQNGCDHACTFCIIPAGRGSSRSVPADTVVERVRTLVAAGHREVVLTGVDVTSWGQELPGAPVLGSLVEAVLVGVPGLPRLRLSSLDAVEIDDRLFDLVTGEARVMPHLHLSLQAGSDMVLKRMRRRHLRADAVRLVDRIKARRDVAIGADLIAGFPTEDAGMFADTLALLGDCDVVHAHIFPYSPREGTPAARMPQVAPDVRRERAALLREAAAGRKAAWLADRVGTVARVLVERPGDRGHDEQFAAIRLDAWQAPGSIVDVALTHDNTGHVRTGGGDEVKARAAA